MDDTPTSRLLGGRYRLIRAAGHGGMSEVHVARDEVLGRDVAVKLVRADHVDGPSGVAALEREARATAGLSHPNVVVVHDVLREGHDAAIVMELVRGETLADRLRRDGPLPWRDAVDLAGRMADGLGAAHAVGLVHRDVKPSNVLLGDDGRLRVADFGIAGLVDASTRTSTVRGSIPYLAPEQAEGQRTDARTDVYALGCVLHEMLVGRPPFADDTGAAIVGQHLYGTPTPPSERTPGLPPGLDALVLGMLAKAPDERPTDMAAVRTALDDLADGRATVTAVLPDVSATPPPTGRGATAAGAAAPTVPVRDRPARSPVLVAVAVIALLGALVVAWQLVPRGTRTDPPAAASTPSPTATATDPGSPTTTPSPSPVTSTPDARPGTIAEAAAAYRSALAGGRDDGEASAKAVDELDKLVTEVVKKDREDKAKDVRDRARELKDKGDELVEKGELTASLARELDDAAQEFLRLA